VAVGQDSWRNNNELKIAMNIRMAPVLVIGPSERNFTFCEMSIFEHLRKSSKIKQEVTHAYHQFRIGGSPGIAADEGSGWHGLTQRDGGFPGTLPELIAQGADLLGIGRSLGQSPAIDLNAVRLLPPVPVPPKILAVGLNYNDHLEESGLKKPDYPEIFARFATSLIAHQEPIRRPRESTALDYEAELAVVIGKPGRRIPKEQALDHVAGYSLFNDASLRDFQLRTPQWTMGKNFDGTGSFGPWLVTPDAVPPGARGLRIQGR